MTEGDPRADGQQPSPSQPSPSQSSPGPELSAEQALSYEQARDELSSVVKKLEAGGLSLEQSLALWERGEELAAICAQWLDGARAKLSAAMAARDDDAIDPDAPF